MKQDHPRLCANRQQILRTIIDSAYRMNLTKGHLYRINISYTRPPKGELTKPLPAAIDSVLISLRKIRKNIFGHMSGNQFVISATHKASDELATVYVSCNPYNFLASLCCAQTLDRQIGDFRRRQRVSTPAELLMTETIVQAVRSKTTEETTRHAPSLPSPDNTLHDHC